MGISYQAAGGEWRQLCEVPDAGPTGTHVVRPSSGLGRPREALWRCGRSGSTCAEAYLSLPSRERATREAQATLVCEEMAYNVCQWYGSTVLDGRPAEEFGALRIRGSVPAGPGAERPSGPWRGAALLVGEAWDAEQLQRLRPRVLGELFWLPDLREFARRFPFLCAAGAEESSSIPVLPNLVLPNLYLGQQSHALSLERWRSHLGVTHVVNLAGDRVPSVAEGVSYIVSPKGTKLQDISGEGQAFTQLAGELLPAVAAALSGGGGVFVHCQQGRSRSCALVVAYLVRQCGRTLGDALAHVSARRPEMEINEEYVRTMLPSDAPPGCSLGELLQEHPRWIRRTGVAREHHERVTEPADPASGGQGALSEHSWDLGAGDDPQARALQAEHEVGGEAPSFNRAAHRDQLAIARCSGYGETLLDIMRGLGTDRVAPQLYLGTMADAAYLPFLRHIGVTHIVSCAAEAQPPPYKHVGWFQYLCLPWRDSAEQGRLVQKGGFVELQRATRFIHEATTSGGVVLVHCVQGISRSAAVVVAFLQEFRGLAVDEAIAVVRQAHPVALRPFPFQEMLRAFHYRLQAA